MKMQVRVTSTLAAIPCILLLSAGLAKAQLDIEVLTFETVEENEASNIFGALNSSVGLDGVNGGLGITEGSQALLINDVPAANSDNFIAYGFSSSDTGEAGDNFAAFNAAHAAMESGKEVFLSFDFGFDSSGVTNDFGFFQPGIAVNSDAGFSELRFGNLLEGNIGPAATSFPTLDSNAATAGVTMEVLDPSNAPDGDPRGLVRVVIPIGHDGTKPLNIGDGGDGLNDFFQLQFHRQGGWEGTIDVSFDRVGFIVIPEPSSLILAALGLTMRLTGRRRR